MSYQITWLDGSWTKAHVMHKRWFRAPRVTEVKLVPDLTGHGSWYHSATNTLVDGDDPNVYGGNEWTMYWGSGLQRSLWRARIRNLNKAYRERISEQNAKVQSAWSEVKPLPEARVHDDLPH